MGADTLEKAVQTRQELNCFLDKAKMKLRKWRSNSDDLLYTTPGDLKEKNDLHISSAPSKWQKALGLQLQIPFTMPLQR